jgi:hypothetical protein
VLVKEFFWFWLVVALSKRENSVATKKEEQHQRSRQGQTEIHSSDFFPLVTPIFTGFTFSVFFFTHMTNSITIIGSNHHRERGVKKGRRRSN